MPCCDGTPRRSPAGGVAETLLHETAGRGLRYGDCSATVATMTITCSGLDWNVASKKPRIASYGGAFDAGVRTLASMGLDKP